MSENQFNQIMSTNVPQYSNTWNGNTWSPNQQWNDTPPPVLTDEQIDAMYPSPPPRILPEDHCPVLGRYSGNYLDRSHGFALTKLYPSIYDEVTVIGEESLRQEAKDKRALAKIERANQQKRYEDLLKVPKTTPAPVTPITGGPIMPQWIQTNQPQWVINNPQPWCTSDHTHTNFPHLPGQYTVTVCSQCGGHTYSGGPSG
jgi:hypothetical protein